MDIDKLYISCLKMLKDKYSINEYSKDKFINIFNNTYIENNINSSKPTNEINKLILIKIKNEIEEQINTNNISNPPLQNIPIIDIENKLKEFENIRANMNLISSSIDINEPLINDDNNEKNFINPISSIQINNQNHDLTLINKFKTFIINTNKNNFKVNPNIDINNNIIYPCYLCIPYDISNKTPYILLSINDNTKIINYTYILDNSNSNNKKWEIWKPITDNYININLNSNNWTITFIDYLNNIIDLSIYNYPIIDVLENISNETFSLKIENHYDFNINNKIKIIKDNNIYTDNIIINKDDNNRIIIKKNNLILKDFINSKIYNYNSQLSLLFKYYSK